MVLVDLRRGKRMRRMWGVKIRIGALGGCEIVEYGWWAGGEGMHTGAEV